MHTNISDVASKILAHLKANSAADSWNIKLALHLKASEMYMALGMLLEQGKITIEAKGLSYIVSAK
ncbi:hypothetical protein Dip518_001200 [Parelusimicrobium proximum]|uniref:hypothetical protein n=1 Tax=Parelusimicrobium proximum TaxID=3228953 RepID=UPI003D16CBAD